MISNIIIKNDTMKNKKTEARENILNKLCTRKKK